MDMTQYAGKESNYLKASDIGKARPTVTIEKVSLLEFDDDDKGKETKPALKFVDKEKSLVCNATNTAELIHAFGKDSDNWIGKKIILSTKFYSTFGKEGIVVQAVVEDDSLNDEIPF